MTTTTDTLQIAKRLKGLDFNEAQAEGLAEIVRDVEESRMSEFATKSDLYSGLDSLRAELYKAMFAQTVAIIAGTVGILQLL